MRDRFQNERQSSSTVTATDTKSSSKSVLRKIPGQVQCLKLVIPELSEAEEDGSPEVRNSRPAWPTWRNSISAKNTKISQMWWHTLVIPATPEAEAGESLKPGSQDHATALQPGRQSETPSKK